MKKAFSILFVIMITAASCQAQWKFAQWDDAHVFAFGAHDTSTFFMSSSLPFDADLWRFVPTGITGKWVPANTGIDSTQGTVTSFASLGIYFFAGMTLRGGPGTAYVTSDNGAKWNGVIGGPIHCNGYYLFAQSYSAYGQNPQITVRSKDSGLTWDSVATQSVTSFASNSACVYAIEPDGLTRSLDTGNTWSQLHPPYVGPMTTMDSLLFITAGGNVIKSTDSGITWSAVTVDSVGTPEKVNMLVASKGNLFAGTPAGVLLSTDTGHTWRAENAGLTRSINVYTMGVFDTLLFVANTPGDSVFYRSIPEMAADTGPASVVSLPSQNDSIAIYPNPTSGTFSISSSEPILSIQVTSILGTKVIDIPKIDQESLPLDLSRLSSGTYFIQIKTPEGVAVRKVVRE